MSGAVFTLVMFVQPAISGHSFWRRLGIGLAWFVFSSAFLMIAAYAAKATSVLASRLRAYEELSNLVEQQKRQIEKAREVNLTLSQELTNSRKFEIEKTLYYSETLYLVLKKKRGVKLEVGHKVIVLDAQDGGIMGEFKVSEVLSGEYRARADFVSPVWLGFVHQDRNAEMPAPPNVIAMFFP